MKRRWVLLGFTVLVGFFLLALATCENPAGGGNDEEGEFTISLGNGSAGKAAAYPPDYPPAAIPTGNPLIEDLRFEITFTPVAVGNGEKKEFSFNGDETIGGKVKVGKYTVTMDVYEIADDSYLYATGSAENSPVEIKGGRINPIKVLLYDAHNARMPAISIQPTDTTLIQSGTGTLTIGVLPPTDTGTLASLSYQWYSNTTPSNSGGTVLNSSIDIANGSQTETFSPDTAAIGTFYYYVVVTNTNLSVTGNTTTDAISNVATVGVISSISFVEVTSITSLPTNANVGNFTLSGTVNPATASNQTITWSVRNAGTTGATISGNTLTTTSAGTVTVTATISNGLALGDYTQNFAITVSAAKSLNTWTIVGGATFLTDNDMYNLYAMAFGTVEVYGNINKNRWYGVGSIGGSVVPAGPPPGRIMYSDDDGATWTFEVFDANPRYPQAIAYGGPSGQKRFIIGSIGGKIFYSSKATSPNPQGLVWEEGIGHGLADIFSVTYSNGVWIATSQAGNYISMAYSNDNGVNWTPVASSGFDVYDMYARIAFGNNRFVAGAGLGSSPLGTITYSTDNGATWTKSGTTGSNVNGISYGNGVFVFACDTLYYSTDDAISWTASTVGGSGLPGAYKGVIYDGPIGQKMFVAGTIGRIVYSSDGVTWSSTDYGTTPFGTTTPNNFAYGNGRFFSWAGAGLPLMMCEW